MQALLRRTASSYVRGDALSRRVAVTGTRLELLLLFQQLAR